MVSTGPGCPRLGTEYGWMDVGIRYCYAVLNGNDLKQLEAARILF